MAFKTVKKENREEQYVFSLLSVELKPKKLWNCNQSKKNYSLGGKGCRLRQILTGPSGTTFEPTSKESAMDGICLERKFCCM